MIGTRLAHYEILAKLGEGGMGEVWRARDTSLDREVAIKILPREFAEDAERLARFEREAKLLASLNHPNIAAVYGLHAGSGTDAAPFIAMEYVAGEDLAERLARGRLPVDEAIGIARQVVLALEAAHGGGVIHRDLKPANIRVTRDGTVKILDFGLAKVAAPGASTGADPALSPTMTSVGSTAGMLMGTAGYMSPEQARAQDVDERSDIWSFGCVLWESLTGQMLFGGKTVSDSIGAILHTEPDPAALPADTPPAVRRLLERCLAKDARNRLHHIADARLELDATDPVESGVGAGSGTSRGSKIAIVALAIALAVSLVAALLPFVRPDAAPPATGATNPLAGARFSKISDFPGSKLDAAISSDGRFVAFVSNRDGPFEIHVGQIGTGDYRPLVSGEGQFAMKDARAPVRSVGFNHDASEIWLGGGPWRRVRLVPLLGGPLRNFLSPDTVSVAWSSDGERVVSHERIAGDPLYVADSDGTNSRLVLGPPAGVHQHYPIWSTDGQWIYFVRGRPNTLEMDLWRVRPDGEDPEQLTHRKLDVRYPTPIDARTVLYVGRDADGAGPWLWTLDVDTKVSRRASVGLESYASVAASADGRRLVATVQDPSATLWSVPILDRLATEDDAAPFAGVSAQRALAPRFSGSTLFYLSSRGSGDGLWRSEGGRVTEIWRGNETALLEPAAVSPDGKSIALLVRRDEGWHLNVISADGAQRRVLSQDVDARGAAAWSPDGRWVVTGGSAAGVEGLFKIPVDGGAAERIADGEAMNPVWSPDGNLIVYSGAQVNVVAPLVGVRPDGTPVELPKIEVFRDGERGRFLPDGSGLVYMQGSGPAQDFWLLDLATMTSRRLTEFDSTATMRTFDVTPDGKHIVFDRLSEESDLVLIELKPAS